MSAIRSMTAFARRQFSGDWGNAIWEIRSVNQRFLEPNFRLPENLRHLEMQFRPTLRNKIQRGKLDCALKLETSATQGGLLQVDETLVEQLQKAHGQLREMTGQEQSLDLNQMLQWPGMLQVQGADTEGLEKDILAGFSETVGDLIKMREREGMSMKTMIEERLEAIDNHASKVRDQMPAIIEWQRDKLRSRFEEAQINLDSERVEQEMVMLAQKVDVAEEIDRLMTHTKEVNRLLAKGGTVGRKLDFLMQELNREANTLGSKSINADITASSVELKVLIEQMREQIQNIE